MNFSTEMYLDNEVPTGSVIVNASSTKVTAVVSAIDNHSRIVKYGYYLQKDNSSCPTSGYIVSTNANYSFLDSYTSGEYYVCVQLIDALGNTSIVMRHTTLTTREIPVRGAIGEVITISDSFYYNIHLLGKGSTVNFKQTLDMYAIWMSE